MMIRSQLNTFFDDIMPNESQKKRMLSKILAHEMRSERRKTMQHKRVWIPISVACLALVVALAVIMPFGNETIAYAISINTGEDGAKIKLADNENVYEDFGVSVRNVNSRPDLEFYIEGEDIAKIELTCGTEYLYVVDWTKTQQEKYWNSDIYQQYDEENQQMITNYDLLYDKSITLTFDEGFDAYEDIWYRWTAWDMYNWASEDDYSHISGADIDMTDATPEELLMYAAGSDPDGNPVGYIQLDGYPEELTEDRITVTITDRKGNSTTQVIHIKVSNDEMNQTIVTASIAE